MEFFVGRSNVSQRQSIRIKSGQDVEYRVGFLRTVPRLSSCIMLSVWQPRDRMGIEDSYGQHIGL